MNNTSFTRFLGRSQLYLKKNASTILTCIGAVGVMTTAVLTVDATIKAVRILDSAKREKDDDLTTTEIVKMAGPVYIPAIAIGVSTIACIFSANIWNKQQQVAVTSAYAVLNNYHKKYRKKLIELHGEEADIDVRNAMVREYCNYHQSDSNIPEGKAIFYDEISGESVIRYEREIIDAEYHFNRNFTMRGYAFLNEFYDFLGLPTTEYGGAVGWSMASGIMWVDFEHRLIDNDDGGPAVYSIDMIFSPEILEEWEC